MKKILTYFFILTILALDLCVPIKAHAEIVSATGGTITTVGNDKVHTFTSSGTFTVTSGSGNVKVLIIAGGGSGGTNSGPYGAGGGGGGGGGYVYNASYAVTAQGYTVTIGAGGAAGALYDNAQGNDGGNSVFGTITATGGGGGGAGSADANDQDGRNGGSGGGAARNGTGGSGSQGYDGADGTSTTDFGAGGGGGGGGAGDPSASNEGGDGGAGYACTILDNSTDYYAGGAGGGARIATSAPGGTGGGGAGGSTTVKGGAGTANTGGGGGGCGWNNTWGSSAGGTGIVIVRYTPLAAPAAPTNVAATDGSHTDKVTVTWTKSTGATAYKVYEGSNLLDTLGDVATYDDTAAAAGSITAGSAVATDGSSTANVGLSLSGTSTSNGATRTYKVTAGNAAGYSGDSSTNTGYRSVGALGYQWNRSSGDADSGYSTIGGATASTYSDTAAPAGIITPGTTVATDGSQTAHVALSLTSSSVANGAGRYFTCTLTSTGASNTPATATANRGYRTTGALTYQWVRSAADSDASYGSLGGATASTYNDTAAPAGTITPGTATASDGASLDYVTLSLAGESVADGAGRYFKCTQNATGTTEATSTANRGHRGTGALTLQWQRSAADSDASYSNIASATTDPYNDTAAPVNGDGRYFKCVEDATGTVQATSTADRGYRDVAKQKLIIIN